MQQTKNKWLIVLAAIGIHISIGSVYAWSVLTKPIMQAMGFSLKVDLLSGDFVFGHVRRLSWYVCRKIWPASQWPCVDVLFRQRSFGYGVCADAAKPAAFYICSMALLAVLVWAQAISRLCRRS